jgi:PAS domain S-box-containing protein/putative nucleotidyltransferase with HDIG domain
MRTARTNAHPDAEEAGRGQPRTDSARAAAATDRRALELLKVSETRYRRLFEAAQDGILLLDAETGEITDANPFLLHMLGYSHKEIVGKRLWEIGPFADKAGSKQAFGTLRKERYIRYENLPLETASGTTIEVEFVSNTYPVDGKDVIQCNIRDTAKHRLALEKAGTALQASDLRYREVVENAVEAIFVAQDGRIVFLNPATCMVFGRSNEELLARPFVDFIHPDDRDMVLERHRARAKGEEPPSVYPFRVVREDGAVRWVEVRTARVDWQGKSAGLSLLSDITERRRAEMERERLLERQIVVGRVALALGSLTEPHAVLRALYAEIRMLVDAGGFFLSWYQKDTGLITTLYAVDGGMERDVSALPPVPLAPEGRGMESQVLRTGEPLSVPRLMEREDKIQSARDGPVAPPPPEDERGECRGSALLAPMMLQGESVGVLRVQSNRPDAYSAEDAHLLAGLANVAAISIQNALLIDKARRATAEVLQGLNGTVQALARTTEMRDPYTAGHQERVARLACTIARKMGLGENGIEGLRVAALLHDVGKVSVPAEILSKPTLLTPSEFALVRQHAQAGHDILRGIAFPWPVAEIVLQHHERLDGSGYPNGLSDGQMLPEAGILAVADVVEAMSSHRPYRPARGVDEALAEIERNRGILYDSAAAEACVALFRDEGFRFTE